MIKVIILEVYNPSIIKRLKTWFLCIERQSNSVCPNHVFIYDDNNIDTNFLLKIIDFFFFLLFRIKSNSSTWKSSDSYFFLFLAIQFVIILYTASEREWANDWLFKYLNMKRKRRIIYIYIGFFRLSLNERWKKTNSVTSICERVNSRLQINPLILFYLRICLYTQVIVMTYESFLLSDH
jgi:hypothetical protein